MQHALDGFGTNAFGPIDFETDRCRLILSITPSVMAQKLRLAARTNNPAPILICMAGLLACGSRVMHSPSRGNYPSGIFIHTSPHNSRGGGCGLLGFRFENPVHIPFLVVGEFVISRQNHTRSLFHRRRRVSTQPAMVEWINHVSR